MSATSARPVKRLRFMLNRQPSKEQLSRLNDAREVSFLPMEAIGEDGKLDLSTTREMESVAVGYTQFFDGDVVVAKITPCFENGKGALVGGLMNGVGFGTTELHVLSPCENLNARFLYYITNSLPFRQHGEAAMTGAAGQKRVPEEFIKDYRVPVMTLNEQHAIVEFLDRETARLDALVAEKGRWLELLAEKRRTLIATAVTRGIIQNAELLPSGVEWLGDIPNSWATRRVKYLFDLILESAPADHEFELLSVYTEIGVEPRSELEARGNKATSTEDYWIVRPGDLVVNKLLAWMGALGVSAYDGVTSPAYDILRPKSGVNSMYYHHLFRCGICFTEFRRRSAGIMDMRLRLYFDKFGDMRVPLPPPDEQRAIVAYISEETAKLDALRAATERTIRLLQERRAALVAAAVTGQLKVA